MISSDKVQALSGKFNFNSILFGQLKVDRTISLACTSVIRKGESIKFMGCMGTRMSGS